MKQLAALTLLVAFATSAQAAPESYVIDNTQTVANFSFSYLGGASQTHKFDKTSGKVVFDRAARTGTVDVSIDAASINTGLSLFNAKIQSEDFFDTARHPVITFKSSKMEIDGDQLSLAGDLTIKGVTKPVSLAVTRFKCSPLSGIKGDTCVAHATVTVKRSDFNMGKFGFLASNDVTLNLAIGAVKEQAMQVASR
jgi:polyisoprenoid-binding protein YceI